VLPVIFIFHKTHLKENEVEIINKISTSDGHLKVKLKSN